MTEEHVPEHLAEEEPVVGDAPPQAHTLLSNSVYDKLKFVAVILLPALGTLYFGIAGIWGLPAAQEVVGTIVVIDTFLGGLMHVTTAQYQNSDARFDGQILVEPGEDPDTSQVRVQAETAAVANKDEVVLKVKRT